MKYSLHVIICLIAYLIFGLAVAVVITHVAGELFFVWNVFLAFLPFLFARLLRVHMEKRNRKKLAIILLAFLWLIFFPNAPYMITDLIYLGGTNFYSTSGSDMIYTTRISEWILLVYLASGVIFAALLGLASLADIHAVLKNRFGRLTSGAAIAAVCLLSGFGIYLGRMLRFNSWDVLQPMSLLSRVKDELSSFSILFSMLFAVYIAASYIIFRVVTGGAAKAPAPGRQLEKPY